MRDPHAQPAYRVVSSGIDELYEKERPPAPVRPAVGKVTSRSSTDRTFEVNDAEETITVVAMGDMPEVGDDVEYHLVDGLAYLPEPTVFVFVQPNEPDGAVRGTLWFDTDETM